MTFDEATNTIIPGRYRHFKGNEYEVIGIARHSETTEPMVVYKALYGDGGLWVRPAFMWNEEIERDGKKYKRFTRIGYQFYGWENANIKDASGRTPGDYFDILSDIWCADTCAPRMRDQWTPENPTYGQCSITAFLMQDIFGGKVWGILRPDGNYHCFNDVDGCVFDLTSEQFGDEKLNYCNCSEQFRELHFAKEEKRQRYEHLRSKLYEHLQICRDSVDEDEYDE